MADYYSCTEGDCVGVFGALDRPLGELSKSANAAQFAIDRLRAGGGAPQEGLVDQLHSGYG